MVNRLAVFFDLGDTLADPRTVGDRLIGLTSTHSSRRCSPDCGLETRSRSVETAL